MRRGCCSNNSINVTADPLFAYVYSRNLFIKFRIKEFREYIVLGSILVYHMD